MTVLDVVIVEKTTGIGYNGEILAVTYDRDNYATLKKIEEYGNRNSDDYTIKLIPLNNTYDTLALKGNELKDFKIIGKPYMVLRFPNE